MNNKELHAYRQLFFLSTSEAAEHIGGVSTRSWQRWEDGTRGIPADIGDKLRAISEKREAMIDAVDDLMTEKGADSLQIDYYTTLAEYRADHKRATVIEWRLAQSVAAYFLGGGEASLK